MSEDTLDPRLHARRTDPETSHEAAERLASKKTMLWRLLLMYASGDFTAEEVADECGYTAADGPWKRVSDLVVLGYIEHTGQQRVGRSGRNQMVRRITSTGWQVVRGEKPLGWMEPRDDDDEEDSVLIRRLTTDVQHAKDLPLAIRKVDKLRQIITQAEERGLDALPLDLVRKIITYREKE
jgi:hypothetical protein